MGRGKYFVKGELRSVFTFSGGEGGVFEAKQRNQRKFCLKPILDGDKPVGFIITFPEEYPKFKASFELSGEAKKALIGIRIRNAKLQKNTAFGKFMDKFSKPTSPRFQKVAENLLEVDMRDRAVSMNSEDLVTAEAISDFK